MRILLVLTLLTLSACAPSPKSASPIYGQWKDVENFSHEFKADSSMTLGSCGIKGSFTEPVNGVMTLFVTEATRCLDVGVHQCEVQVFSQDEIGLACGLLNTRLIRQTN